MEGIVALFPCQAKGLKEVFQGQEPVPVNPLPTCNNVGKTLVCNTNIQKQTSVKKESKTVMTWKWFLKNYTHRHKYHKHTHYILRCVHTHTHTHTHTQTNSVIIIFLQFHFSQKIALRTLYFVE